MLPAGSHVPETVQSRLAVFSGNRLYFVLMKNAKKQGDPAVLACTAST